MVFIVALYTPWCRYLESQADISPQLYADNRKCTSYSVDSVLAAAQYTVSYVHAVGHEAILASVCYSAPLRLLVGA